MQGRRRRLVRLFALLVGLALAIAATATLVLTDDQQLLQLAVIAALWAFLIAAFVAGQRRSADEPASPEAAPVPGAELELAQRREVELLTEVRLRREIEGSLLAGIHALREDMTRMRNDTARMREDTARLRHDILERWDGELHVERIAVRAESTRFSGLGSTFAALQDEARRLQDDGRSRREVTGSPPADEPRPPRDDFDAASTIEFSLIPQPAARVPPAERPVAATGSNPAAVTGPLYGGPAGVEDYETAEFPRIPLGEPPAPARAEGSPGEGSPDKGRRRFRHEADDSNGTVDAAALLRRLQAEPAAGQAPRRRRARADDESNDVLARLIGERAG
ncbi:MAG: hypothetical protein H0T66_10365 [Geodermatophilaceae bacterium]|nr:hypothetical protein [Geodermatophilaceae bacterium]